MKEYLGFDSYAKGDKWFFKYHYNKLTDEFLRWWLDYYGYPEQYSNKNEYFIRCSEALSGWLAHEKSISS